MKQHLLKSVLFFLLFSFSGHLEAQMIEGKVNRYYVVLGSYNSGKMANAGMKKLEKQTSEMLFILNTPNQKIYRVCYAQAKMKTDILQMLEEAKKLFPQAWVLYL